MTVSVQVQQGDFDAASLLADLSAGNTEIGAIASFVGLMRGSHKGTPLRSMTLEHYPGMTESSIEQIIRQAEQRWSLQGCIVVHRIGELMPGEQIVFVGCASSHRQDAFLSCEYIMDFLKSRAPFWKKETTVEGRSHWVDARDSDAQALERW